MPFTPVHERSMNPIRVPAAFACLPLLAALPLAAQETAEPLQVELVAQYAALQPGTRARIGLRLRHAPHWHSYWVNPGDSGLPTRLAWNLPAGWQAGDIDWPLPRRFAVGALQNFGYEGELVLPLQVSVPADARPGTTVPLAVTVKWLACREECIPGKSELALALPVGAQTPAANPQWAGLFADALRAQPAPAPWQGSAELVGERVRIRLRGADLPPLEGLDAQAVQRRILDNRLPSFRREGADLVIETHRSEYFGTAPERFDLVLTAPTADGPRGWTLDLPLHDPARRGASPP